MSLRSAVADADRQLDKHWDQLRVYVENVSFRQTHLSAVPVCLLVVAFDLATL